MLLQEFLSSIPKHKGNERLRMQIKRKIASLRGELEGPPRKGARVQSIGFERSGVALIPLLGYPNSGKSTILANLTKAKPKISEVPFTTKKPTAGPLQFEDIQLQLVEIPSIPLGLKLPDSKSILRICDGILLVVDSSANPILQLQTMIRFLEEIGITVFPRRSNVEMERSSRGGLRIAVHGTLTDCTLKDVKGVLIGYGVKNALVRLYGEVKIEDVEDAILGAQLIYKPAVVLLNKIDLKPRPTGFFKDPFNSLPCIPISAIRGDHLGSIGKTLFEMLKLIRVYTKEPGERSPTGEPFVFKGEVTIAELARKIHTSFLENFKYARVWGSSKYPGERVGLDHKLCDGDIVEIRLK